MKLHIDQGRRLALPTLCAALLAACAGASLPELSTLAPSGAGPTTTVPNVPGGSSTSNTDTSTSGGQRPAMAPPFTVSSDEVKAMLIRSDPKACSATSDATPSEIAATYAKIGLIVGSQAAFARLSGGGQMQGSLNQMKPYLRDLSRNTVWLPIEAERMVGDYLYANNKLELYKPPARQRPLLDQTVMPIFNEMKRFAADDLKSPLKFELRVVRMDQSLTPFAIAGGLIIVPSGMFITLQGVKDPAPVVAFMLAHEFSHALRRHKTKMVQLSLVDSITMANEYKQIANTIGPGMASGRPDQMFKFTTENMQSLMDQTCKSRNWLTSLEQNQEFEADVCGALLLKKLNDRTGRRYSAVAGYTQYRDGSFATVVPPTMEGSCTILTSHPDSTQRLEHLRAYESSLAPASRAQGQADSALKLTSDQSKAASAAPAKAASGAVPKTDKTGEPMVPKSAGVKVLKGPLDTAAELQTLTLGDTVKWLGEVKNGYSKVIASKGEGWVKSVQLRKP